MHCVSVYSCTCFHGLPGSLTSGPLAFLPFVLAHSQLNSAVHCLSVLLAILIPIYQFNKAPLYDLVLLSVSAIGSDFTDCKNRHQGVLNILVYHNCKCQRMV